MHIQYAESLKAWLTGVLEPLCDADPSALARYVLALLKKDKPVKELQQCMTEQLDVFLGAETEPFVERLFVVIKTEEYKTAADTLAEAADAAEPSKALEGGGGDPATGITVHKPAKECTPPLFDSTNNTKTKDSADSRNGNDSDLVTPTTSTISSNSSVGGSGGNTLISPIVAPHSKSSGGQETSTTSGHGKYSNRDDNHGRESRRRRGSNHRSRSPRSRSRSYDRSRRSRSRDRRPLDSNRVNQRGGNYNNNHRNKSPIVLGGGGGRNRYDRPKNERNSGYGGRHGNRNRTSPSRSLSPATDVHTKLGSRKERSMSPNATTGVSDMEPPKKRQRCRDFDEKGYCMRGETCEWDHGVDPVVLEDINNPALLSIQSGAAAGPMGRSASGQLHGEYNPDAPDLWNRGGVNFMPNRGPLAGRLGGVAAGNNGPQSVGVFPRAPLGFRGPAVGGATGFPFPTNPTATPLQRELIPVPVLDGGQGGIEMTPQQQHQHQQMMKKRYEPEDSVAIAEGGHPPMMNMGGGGGGVGGGGGHKRKMPMNSRLGPRMGGPPGGQQQNCSLELRKIPRGLNAIAHLNNHFSKFGKIVNIQISYEGDPEAAIVTFSTHAEANVAYRSTEAVLNNRFIKVFWHSANAAANAPPESNLTASGLTKSENKMSLRRQHPPPSQPVGMPAPSVAATADSAGQSVATSTASTSSTTSSVTSPAGATAAAQKTSASNAAIITANHLRLKNQRINRAASEIIRKKQEEQVKTAVQLAHGLHKRKHDLLQEYLKQMRSLVELVERTDHADPQRPPLLATIKELQTSIDKLKKEIEQEQAKISAQAQNQPPQRKTKEQQQKELLDVELELITQEHGGSTDTANIRKRYQELQRSLLSAKSQIGVARTPANIRPAAPRLAPHGTTSVDRRTTTVQIVGFAVDDADALLGHFKHFGEITKNVLDKDVPFLQITYATRVNAEQAILRGKKFKDSVLQLTWVSKDIAAPAPGVKVSEELAPTQATGTTPTSSQQTNNNADEQGSVDLDMDTSSNLNLEEEEEEDVESEDRSWRR